MDHISTGSPILEAATDPDFDACTAFTRAEEGGYVDDPRDSGNWSDGLVGSGLLIGSNMGVGAPALVQWLADTDVTAETMRMLTPAIYGAIARANYWNPMSCADMLPGVDLMLFDFGWNRGIDASIRLIQRVVGVPDDGICGRATLHAAHSRNGTALIDALSAAQTDDYRNLENFGIYGRGWLARTDCRHAAALLQARTALFPQARAARHHKSTPGNAGRDTPRHQSSAAPSN